MKKLFILLGLVVGGLLLAACTTATVDAATYIGVDINPSIEFTVDENNEVVTFKLLNEDAEIVAADLDFVGMDFEEALELYLDAAVEAGYLDVNREDNAILLTVANEDSEVEEQIRERIREKTNKVFHKHSIGGAIIEAEIDNEEILALAEQYEVSPGKVRIAIAAQLSDPEAELDLAELVTLSVRELMQLIHADHQEAMNAFKQERRTERLEVKEALKEQLRARIQEHKEQVENEEYTPMTNEEKEVLRNEFMDNAQQKREEYQARMQEQREQAMENKGKNRP